MKEYDEYQMKEYLSPKLFRVTKSETGAVASHVLPVKVKLTNFRATDWQENPERWTQLQEKMIFVTFEEKCCNIYNTIMIEVDSLKCRHEEANTRLLLHAHHAGENGHMP